MGYASSTIEHSYVMPEIRNFLAASNLTQREFLLEGLHQMLLNEGFHQWHGYRLVWGDASPESPHVAYPNGVDIKWTLYRLINGQVRVLLQGELPANWWDLEPEDRRWLAEQHILDVEESSPKFVQSAVSVSDTITDPVIVPNTQNTTQSANSANRQNIENRDCLMLSIRQESAPN